jgi:hypothetical protein
MRVAVAGLMEPLIGFDDASVVGKDSLLSKHTAFIHRIRPFCCLTERLVDCRNRHGLDPLT